MIITMMSGTDVKITLDNGSWIMFIGEPDSSCGSSPSVRIDDEGERELFEWVEMNRK